jgi:cyclase
MLAKRVIPTMLVRGRTLVKGERFNGWRSIGHAAQAARIHAARGVDELCILDIGATSEGRGPDLDLVRELSDGCFIPITVGGGIRSLQDIDTLLRAGADKVCIGRGQDIAGLIYAASARFGGQAIVASLDVWPELRAAAAMRAWALERMGAGELLLQSPDRDGCMSGYDLVLINEVSAAVGIPVIASGGCRDYADMAAAFKAGADACAAGALFSFTDATPKGAARYLKQHGMEVRA